MTEPEFGSKDQLRLFTARVYSRMEEARKRYIDEVRAILAEELDTEFPQPKEGT